MTQPRGILNFKSDQQKFHLSRQLPSEDLRPFIEHYWIIDWDLRGQEPYQQETLPHPSVHLVFEKNNTNMFGVMTGKFSYLLQDKGRVFGIKFKPGAFYAFYKQPVSRLTDTALPILDKPLEDAILTADSQNRMVELAESFLRAQQPQQDENIELIQEIFDRINTDRTITKVDDLALRLGIGTRTLQRLFSQYVGVSPKWVIKRYRLHEAAEQLASGDIPDWPQLAADLGYYDQSHFIKDFKTIIGRSPEEYAKGIGT